MSKSSGDRIRQLDNKNVYERYKFKVKKISDEIHYLRGELVGVQKEHLEQEGLIGLWEAMQNYDHSLGKFWPYAETFYIRTRMNKYINNWVKIRGSREDQKKNQKIKNAKEKLRQKHQKDMIYLDEIAHEIGETLESVSDLEGDFGLYKNFSIPETLSPYKDDNEDECYPEEEIENRKSPSPERLHILNEAKDKIEKLIESWPTLDQEIIKMRLGLGYDYMFSREEISEKLGIHVDKVRRIEENRLKELQNKLKEYQDYVE